MGTCDLSISKKMFCGVNSTCANLYFMLTILTKLTCLHQFLQSAPGEGNHVSVKKAPYLVVAVLLTSGIFNIKFQLTKFLINYTFFVQ